MMQTAKAESPIRYGKFPMPSGAAVALVALAAVFAGCSRGAAPAGAGGGDGRDDKAAAAQRQGPARLVEAEQSGVSPVSPASFDEYTSSQIERWDPIQQVGGAPIGQRSFLGDVEATHAGQGDYPSTGVEFWDPLPDTMSPTRQAGLPVEIK